MMDRTKTGLKTSLAILALAASFLAMSCSEALIGEVIKDVKQKQNISPAIEILRGSTAIADSSVVDWGSLPQGATIAVSFQIKNTGTGSLLLDTPLVAPESSTDGFSLVSLSNSSVAAGASTSMTLAFHPTGSATNYTATVTMGSNASNDASVVFSLKGTKAAPDTLAPTGSVSINAAAYATAAGVTLNIAATDTGGGTVTHMEVLNDSNAFTGNWQPYATSLPWTLSSGDGNKIVYIRFRDGSSNSSGAYSDTIILDTANPSIVSYTPTSPAANQSKSTNVTVNFSENMDQTTFTAANVYLMSKKGAPLEAAISSTATSVTLNPTADLEYGYDYNIVVKSGVKDLAGRSIGTQLNFPTATTYFTVERDIWEGTGGNESSGMAYDLGSRIVRYRSDPYKYNQWDMVADQVYEQDLVVPSAAHSGLALLDGVDYYLIYAPIDSASVKIRVLLTNDEAAGTTPATGGPENIILYASSLGVALPIKSTITSLGYDKQYDYDISGLVEGDDIVILVYENSGSYGNARKYNLQFTFHYDGM